MLKQLHIKNLAVVEDVALEFGPGLNVITGTTGAGKSLILGAVNLLLGEKASPAAIRAGQEAASVGCEFVLPRGTSEKDGVTSVEREIRKSGRGRVQINGKTGTIKQLREATFRWIEHHGQNEQLRLRDADTHAGYLDIFAGNESLLESYRGALGGWSRASGELDEFDRRIVALKEKEELLRHRLGEIDRAQLREGELEELEDSIGLMENAEKIFETLRYVFQMADDEETGTSQQMAQAVRRLESISGVGKRLSGFAGRLREIELLFADCLEDMRSYTDGFEFDPEDLQENRERRAHLLDLERRYGKTLSQIIEARNKWEQDIDGVQFAGDQREKLLNRLGEKTKTLQTTAQLLSRARQKAASALDRSMTAELAALMMPGARFRTQFSMEKQADGPLTAGEENVAALANGSDVVRFLVRTNRGETEGPLDEIASTGEISRISLALKKSIQAGRNAGPEAGVLGRVLVFDELDAGVGADLGGVIANNLLELSATYQIICITHMPQIAAAGNRHLVVKKTTSGQRTVTQVEPVRGGERQKEIARMLGGVEGSNNRLALAAELLG